MSFDWFLLLVMSSFQNRISIQYNWLWLRDLMIDLEVKLDEALQAEQAAIRWLFRNWIG